MEVDDKDIAIAFSDTGDTITWQYSPDVVITIYYEHGPIYEYKQGQAYVKGSKMRSYKNSWPVVMLPPRHRYLYGSLDQYHWHNYSVHPNTECINEGQTFCPICSKRAADRQATLYLLCIYAIPRILFIPHFMNRNTISPYI